MWFTKATTSSELAGTHMYGSDISASAIITSKVSPSLASKIMRPDASKAGVNLLLVPTIDMKTCPDGPLLLRSKVVRVCSAPSASNRDPRDWSSDQRM